jgi:hypothetical protein
MTDTQYREGKKVNKKQDYNSHHSLPDIFYRKVCSFSV